MLGNETYLQVVKLYSKNYVDLLSINEIAKRIGKKYPYVHKKVHEMIESGILNMTQLGRSYLCSINLENEVARGMLGFWHSKDSAQVSSNFQNLLMGSKKIPNVVIGQIGRGGKITKYYHVGSFELDKSLEGGSSVPTEQLGFKGIVELFSKDEKLYENHVVLFGWDVFMLSVMKNLDQLRVRYHPFFAGVKS